MEHSASTVPSRWRTACVSQCVGPAHVVPTERRKFDSISRCAPRTSSHYAPKHPYTPQGGDGATARIPKGESLSPIPRSAGRVLDRWHASPQCRCRLVCTDRRPAMQPQKTQAANCRGGLPHNGRPACYGIALHRLYRLCTSGMNRPSVPLRNQDGTRIRPLAAAASARARIVRARLSQVRRKHAGPTRLLNSSLVASQNSPLVK